ncbi:MAG: alkaline phosphatase family protein [Planctomycetota bacterium]
MRIYKYVLAVIITIFVGLILGCQTSFQGKQAIDTPTPEQSSRPRNIILIGWDGAQRNHVNECLSKGELPNIKKLSSEGAYVEIDVHKGENTATKAGWSQILTGYRPEITGVYTNSNYQPIPKGYTVFERLEQYFGADNFITIAVIGKKGHVDADPPQRIKLSDENEKPRKKNKGKKKKEEGKIAVEDGVKYRVIPGKPYYYTKDGMDLFINGLVEDEKVGTKAMELLEKYKNKSFFFFIHFAEVDHNGHKYGENSKEYNDAIISADTWTGKIMQKLKELKLYDETRIYVTADHGFNEGERNHRDAPFIFLATNDSNVIAEKGDRADITPTILDRFGVNLNQIRPSLGGQPLTKHRVK